MLALPIDRDRHRAERACGFAVACLVQCLLVALLVDESGRSPTVERSTIVALSVVPLVPESVPPTTVRSRDDRQPTERTFRRRPVVAVRTPTPPTVPTIADQPTNEPDGIDTPLPYDRDRTAREMRAMERTRSRSASSEAFEAATASKPDVLARGVEKAARADCKEAYRGYLLLAVPFLVKDTLTGKGCKW